MDNIWWAAIAETVKQLATGSTDRDRIPVGTRFSVTFQTGPVAHPTFSTKDTELFPVVKQPERSVFDPPPSTADVKGRVQTYFFSLFAFSSPVLW